MKTVLECVILRSNRWLKIEVTARQKKRISAVSRRSSGNFPTVSVLKSRRFLHQSFHVTALTARWEFPVSFRANAIHRYSSRDIKKVFMRWQNLPSFLQRQQRSARPRRDPAGSVRGRSPRPAGPARRTAAPQVCRVEGCSAIALLQSGLSHHSMRRDGGGGGGGGGGRGGLRDKGRWRGLGGSWQRWHYHVHSRARSLDSLLTWLCCCPPFTLLFVVPTPLYTSKFPLLSVVLGFVPDSPVVLSLRRASLFPSGAPFWPAVRTWRWPWETTWWRSVMRRSCPPNPTRKDRSSKPTSTRFCVHCARQPSC